MQKILFFVTVISVIIIMKFFKAPESKKFKLELKFPTLLNGKDIFWSDIIISSKLPEAFTNEHLSISIKIYNIDSVYYEENLKNRDLVLIFDGLNPIDGGVNLIYNIDDLCFKGVGKVKFHVAGNFKIQIGYSSTDKVLPLKVISTSSLELPILSSETKYQQEMTKSLYLQSKIMLIITIIMAYLALSDFLIKLTK